MRCKNCNAKMIIDEWEDWKWFCPLCNLYGRVATEEEIKDQIEIYLVGYKKHDCIERFVSYRNQALLSLDAAKIKGQFREYGVRVPKDETVFWAGVHKARVEITNFSKETKDVSRQWLVEHGFHLFSNRTK